jgi:hypothetical protein
LTESFPITELIMARWISDKVFRTREDGSLTRSLRDGARSDGRNNAGGCFQGLSLSRYSAAMDSWLSYRPLIVLPSADKNLGAKWAQNPAFLSQNRGMAGE